VTSGDYELSFDPARLDLDRIESFIRQSYWAPARPRDVIEKAIQNSLCLGAYRTPDGPQVGFARVVTDYATFGWVCDVFVDPTARGQHLGVAMMHALTEHPDLRATGLMLATIDAHGLYERFGFKALSHPERWMNRPRPDLPPEAS
jgi:GNAT superfamily N-acetyltransferase